MLKEASDAFDEIDADPAEKLSVGYVATLAVAQLTGLPLATVKQNGASALSELERTELEGAIAGASSEAESRFRAKQDLTGSVWALITNALIVRRLGLELAKRGGTLKS